MRSSHFEPSRPVLFLVALTLSATAVAATPFVKLGKTLADVPPCRAEEASRKAHPPLYPGFLGTSGIKGTVLIDVALENKADAPAAPAPAELAGLQASDVQVQRSTRNRDLDRIAMQTARKWRYVCPSSVPEAQRWARVDIAMDPAVLGSDHSQPLPQRFAIGYFPSWLNAQRAQPGRRATQRDDRLMPRGSVDQIAATVQADPAFKKDETRKPFAMNATWNEREQLALIWWLSDERNGRAKAAVLIVDDYPNKARTYAVRCESSAETCATFAQWLKSVMGTWHPMATWEAAPAGPTSP
ncbi:hypothetical protein [Xanthomonas medicagonis]|uniref:hypothetical protein n=1 Tax=Xanthomonas medicagonis TaxID=3160841 RepID=UPI003519BF69